MPRYLNPKSDLVFKKIFGGHPELLKSFLNAVLPLPTGCLIESLEYLSSENIPEIPEFKHSVVDVRCFDQQQRHFIVEMQMSWSKHFMQRLLFNTASVYVRQLKTAENYRELNSVYGLAIVDGSFSKETDLGDGKKTVLVKNVLERKKFDFAAYNGGEGTIAKAQYLALQDGKDPTNWNDVQAFLDQAGAKNPGQVRKYVERVPKNEAEFAKKSLADKKAKDKKIGKPKNRCTKGHWITKDDHHIFICD